jgi:hypothetical protein
MGYDPHVAAMVHDRDFTIYYADRKDNIVVVRGKMLSTDHDGFVVLTDKNGKMILIPKDRVDRMIEGEE